MDILGGGGTCSALSNICSSLLSLLELAVEGLVLLLLMSSVEPVLLEVGVPGRAALWGLALAASAIVL